MEKRKAKSIITWIIIAGVIGFCVYCVYVNPNMFKLISNINSNDAYKMDEDIDNNNSKIQLTNIFSIGERVKCYVNNKNTPMSCIVNSVTISKEPGIFKNTGFKIFDIEKVDDNGRLISNYSYLIANITLTNESDQLTDEYMGFYICKIDDKNIVKQDGSYVGLRAYDKGKNIKSKSYFRYSLQPNEEINCNLLYVVKDKFLSNRLAIKAGSNCFITEKSNLIDLNIENNKTNTSQ